MNGHADSRFPEVERLPLLRQLFQDPHPDQRPVGSASGRWRGIVPFPSGHTTGISPVRLDGLCTGGEEGPFYSLRFQAMSGKDFSHYPVGPDKVGNAAEYCAPCVVCWLYTQHMIHHNG